MTKRHWISLLLFSFLLLGLQACGRKFEPQEACNFVQSSNQQRVSWKQGLPVRLLIHSSVPTEAYAPIERAVERWNAELGREVLRIDAWGVGGDIRPEQDGYNMVYWIGSGQWESDRQHEQARTTIFWHGDRIFEADLRVNNDRYDFYTGQSGTIHAVDLESLIVHELGHVLGLAHNDNQGSVMNVSLSSGQNRRQPDIQDVDSLRCEY